MKASKAGETEVERKVERKMGRHRRRSELLPHAWKNARAVAAAATANVPTPVVVV